MVRIQEFEEQYGEAIIEFILNIQQNEFGVPITIDDQKDLLNIAAFYQNGKGNFWIAIEDGKLVGTIALIHIGNRQGCLRKLFVQQDFRGKAIGVSALLLNTLLNWARQKDLSAIYLGTTSVLNASHSFYEKNKFELVEE